MKTEIKVALIGAAALIITTIVGLCYSSKTESGLVPENTGQLVPGQQNQAEKIENNQKKEITVQGDYVEGDKFEGGSKTIFNPKKSASNKIDVKELGYLSQEQKEEAGTVTSINQTGGQTAYKITNNYASPQRLISDKSYQLLVHKLTAYTGKKFKIYVSNNDLEGLNLAKRIKSILIDSGWIETGFIFNLAGTYPPGIDIGIGGEPTKSDQVFADSMLQLTDFKINTSKNPEIEDLSIVIGPNLE